MTKRKISSIDHSSEEQDKVTQTQSVVIDASTAPAIEGDEEDIKLPVNIKETIKNNVAELKELLKEEPEFCVELIDTIVNVDRFILPASVVEMVFKHYNDVISQCRKENKAWPIKIIKVQHIADLLSHLVSGYQKLIFDVIGTNEADETYRKCHELGVLSRIEIGTQFNPDIDYYITRQPGYEEAMLFGDDRFPADADL